MRLPLLAVLAILLSGCVAIPAVERRANSASQASWAREKCSDSFDANGLLTPEAVRGIVDIRKAGNPVQCDGRAIDFFVSVYSGMFFHKLLVHIKIPPRSSTLL